MSSQSEGGRPAPPLGYARVPEALPDRERRNPWLRWGLHLGLPVGVSLVFHAAFFITLGLVTWQVLGQREVAIGEYEAGIVNSPADATSGVFQWPGPARLDAPVDSSAVYIESLGDLRTLADLELRGLESGVAASDATSGGGFGLGGGRHGGILGIGGGAGEPGTGGFGSGLGERGTGQAGVWSLRAPGNKFVYVVDFSGSIIVAADDLKRELKRSVGRLEPPQTFNVIIFYSEGAGQHDRERFKTESFAPTLQPAAPEVKRRFFAWIAGKVPMGSTEPLPAVRRALQMKPDAIFFFSDGYFEDAYVDEIRQANREVGARMHCLVFDEILLQDASGLPRMTDGARRLQRIAEQNGGGTKVVTGTDLERE